MITIQKNHVVSIDYTLKNDEGNVLDTSSGGSPLTYLHGAGALIPGMENALEGKTEGDDFTISIAPAEAYGNHDQNLLHKIDRKELAHLPDLELGMELEVMADNDPLVMTIVELSDDLVVLDGNHPLAGQTLNFDIQVRNVREASADEISHGHVHGPGGHHH
jgi:FKBP-type peptidyl-prolyl cis-trans isomerase SlyD